MKLFQFSIQSSVPFKSGFNVIKKYYLIVYNFIIFPFAFLQFDEIVSIFHLKILNTSTQVGLPNRAGSQ